MFFGKRNSSILTCLCEIALIPQLRLVDPRNTPQAHRMGLCRHQALQAYRAYR